MKFYKIIAKNYENYLVENGVLALEIGYDEADDIRALFEGKNVVIKKGPGKLRQSCNNIQLNKINHKRKRCLII